MSFFYEAEIESVENAPELTLDDVVSYRKKRFKGQGEEQEWAALGVKLSHPTMSKWIMVTHRDWLSLAINLLHQKLLKEQYLHCDETPVQVLQEPGRKNTTDSYMWIYSTAKNSKYPIRFSEYQPGRGGKYPQALLQDFKNYLHTDAYDGYNKVADVLQYLFY